MAIHRVDLTIEAKEDETGDGIAPRVPALAESVARLHDTVADNTKHDTMIGWRVTSVRPAAAGTALVSATDLRHLLDWVDEHGRAAGPYAETAAALRRDLDASAVPDNHEYDLGGEG